MRLLFLGWLFSLLLFANQESNETNSSSITQNVLYLSYEATPSRVIEGEIFSITLKVISVINDFEDIEYQLSNYSDIELLNDGIPIRETHDKFFYDTFYFYATGTNVYLPDIVATIRDYYGHNYKPAFLKGKKIEAIRLNPREDFCNVIAKDLTLQSYKTTTYDATHNIVVFLVTAKQAMLKNFYLKNIFKQGFESLHDTIDSSKMIYYAVIDKKVETLSFSYFNSVKNRYISLSIPIIVEDDSVTTQSDLNPQDQSKRNIKMLLAAGVIFFGVVMLLWRQRYIYILFIVLPALYIAMLFIPQKSICLKEGSKITILPLQNSTIFEITDRKKEFTKIGSSRNYIKIELDNHKIGWVRDEDLCTY